MPHNCISISIPIGNEAKPNQSTQTNDYLQSPLFFLLFFSPLFACVFVMFLNLNSDICNNEMYHEISIKWQVKASKGK